MYLESKQTGAVGDYFKRSMKLSLGEGDIATVVTNFVSNYWILLLPLSAYFVWQMAGRSKSYVKSSISGYKAKKEEGRQKKVSAIRSKYTEQAEKEIKKKGLSPKEQHAKIAEHMKRRVREGAVEGIG